MFQRRDSAKEADFDKIVFGKEKDLTAKGGFLGEDVGQEDRFCRENGDGCEKTFSPQKISPKEGNAFLARSLR